MRKLFIEQLPFTASTDKNRRDGFYVDLHPDKSVKALYNYVNGKCIYEAHLDDTYQSGSSTNHFVFADTGYLDGWTDFDGSPAMDTLQRDALPQSEQDAISRYEEFVDWVKQDVFGHFANTPKVKLHTCSFCGKTNEEVAKIIAGPDVTICNECVSFCNEVLAG